MDTSNEPARPITKRALVFGFGGTVAPADMAKRLERPPPREAQREHFEIYDPFAEVRHRADTPYQIRKLAERIGSNRYTHVAADGARTVFEKVDGEWQPRAPQVAEQSVPQESAPHPEASRQPAAASDIPLRSAATAPAPAQQLAETKTDEQLMREARSARLQLDLMQRYVVAPAPFSLDALPGQTEYRFRARPTTVAFTASRYNLATETNLPSVARSMIDVAELRGWGILRVSGDAEFKRLAWLESAARGVKAIGYEPTVADLENLKKEREARATNHVEPARADGATGQAGSSAPPSSARGNGGRKAVLAAIDAVLIAKRVPEKQRAAVMQAAEQKLAERIRDGRPLPKVNVYDKSAPSQRPAIVPTPERQFTREHAAPAR